MTEKREPREFTLFFASAEDRRRNIIENVTIWRREPTAEFIAHAKARGDEVVPVREVMPDEDCDAG